MALKPALLIADEPTTAIDSITQYEILEEFVRIKKEHDTAMIFITHDLGRDLESRGSACSHESWGDRRQRKFFPHPASCLRSVYETSRRKTVSRHEKVQGKHWT